MSPCSQCDSRERTTRVTRSGVEVRCAGCGHATARAHEVKRRGTHARTALHAHLTMAVALSVVALLAFFVLELAMHRFG